MSNREPFIKSLLAHPLTKGLDIDDPRVTGLRRQIIKENEFLRRIYLEWYQLLSDSIPSGPRGPIVELGAGAGFLKEVVPDLLTSDLNPGSKVDVVLDAQTLPFRTGALGGIVMINVLHHVNHVSRLFRESARCIRPGGRLLMIEPWVTRWSKLVYSYLHHEPFQPEVDDWHFGEGGPLSGANGALPWIVFERDRREFERRFPEWDIERIRLMMPFRYLVSGGVSMRPLMPGWAFRPWRQLESLLAPWRKNLAMFAFIKLQRGQ